MDKNKLNVLRDIGYKIRETCGSCKSSCFSSPGVDYGYCEENTYEHQKHGGVHFLSIHRQGWCPKYKRDDGFFLDKFEEFFPPKM